MGPVYQVQTAHKAPLCLSYVMQGITVHRQIRSKLCPAMRDSTVSKGHTQRPQLGKTTPLASLVMCAQSVIIAQQGPVTPLHALQGRFLGTRKTYKRAIASRAQQGSYVANPVSRSHMKSARRDTSALVASEKQRSYVRRVTSAQRDLRNQPCALLVRSATRKASRNVSFVLNGITVNRAALRQQCVFLAITARFKHLQRRHTRVLQAHSAIRQLWQDPMSVLHALQGNSAMGSILPMRLQETADLDITALAVPRQQRRLTTLQADCVQVATCAFMERGLQRQSTTKRDAYVIQVTIVP